MDLDSLVSKINKLSKVIRALTQLALEIGTLIAVIKFTSYDFRLGEGSTSLPCFSKYTTRLEVLSMKRLCVSVSVLAFRIAELLIVVPGLLLLLSRM